MKYLVKEFSFIAPGVRIVTTNKLTVHVLKTCVKTTTRNIADYMDKIIAFLLQLPTELEVMQSVCFTNDLNLLE